MMQTTEAWQVACDFIRKRGYEILARNIYPASKKKSHIHIVAWDRRRDELVFCEVVRRSMAKRIRPMPKLRRKTQRQAITAWVRLNKWEGHWRFDSIEIYGDKNPVIDHIQGIKL